MAKAKTKKPAPKYKVVWDTEHATGEFVVWGDLGDAKAAALGLLGSWIDQFMAKAYDDPCEEWDMMVLNSGVEVWERGEDGEYERVWEPSDKDLEQIGFVPYDDLSSAMRAEYFGGGGSRTRTGSFLARSAASTRKSS